MFIDIEGYWLFRY